MCELTEYGRNVAKYMHFDECLITPTLFTSFIGLVSNGVAMFVLLYLMFHVVCLHRSGWDSLGFPGHSNVIGTPPAHAI